MIRDENQYKRKMQKVEIEMRTKKLAEIEAIFLKKKNDFDEIKQEVYFIN